MQKIIKKISSKLWFFVVFFATLTFLLNFRHISTYWNLPIVGGWDGAGHAAVGEYYAKHIFPSTWGWIPNWFGGMPFPQFYPPLFFFFVALLSKIFYFFSYTNIFKAFVILLQIILSGILAWVTKNITKSNVAGWIGGIICLIFSSAEYFGVTSYGITISSTFNNGFLAQLLGFIFLLFWINYFLIVEENIPARYLSILFLFGII